jgi:pimeloyl-ACP methyl ester carboxylesterase
LTERTARAVFRACEIPGATTPYDRASLKIFYPALPDDGDEQRNAGVVPADDSGAPYPVLIMLPGINVGPESYAWLARHLAMQGIIAVTYSMIAEEMPGYISLTPGLDLGAITPGTWGTRPSGTAIEAIIGVLTTENEAGVLAGVIDVNKVFLAGHSAGGSVALYNANPEWFPQVRGAIAYGAHSGASTMLGFPENTILELPGELPLLLVGGTNDGVMKQSAHRYGDGGSANRMLQTFESGFTSRRKDSYFVEISGANHFSMVWPLDDSTGRHFLDELEQGSGEEIRALLAELITVFVSDALCEATDGMRAFEDHSLVNTFRCR